MNTAKAVLEGKNIAFNVYIIKEEISKKSNLRFSLKKLEKEEQVEPDASIRKKNINITADINEIKKKNQ